MTADRIVSLAPSASETLRELDATERVVGVTHHCPVDAPVVGGWLNPDFEAIEAHDPTLVLTADPLQVDVRDELQKRGHRVVHVEPRTLGDVIESFATLGHAIGRPQEGANLARRARSRIEHVRRLVADCPRPVVYCEEWSDPPTAAGNWVPDAVRAAGGRYPFLSPGERSSEVERFLLEESQPEHVFLHVCGHGERSDPEIVLNRDWSIPAINRGAVHVLDDSLLNQPSPRLIEGIETMAATLHPSAMK
ncbi:cobalamin-binding protein [Haladaptatus caseinilyticus]|uniref:cobalamin-binding protein n=1 Tax=Haladaptatus caseinilyticus TaxID=2993314 RepID=UPI00224A68D9|nr:cobalamin-binding protein [Haladaptatus caseinilyticus]